MKLRGVVLGVLFAAFATAARADVTATVVKGVLVLRGDAGDDVVDVMPSSDGPGFLIRSFQPNSKINGAAQATLGPANAIDVDLGTGADQLSLSSVEISGDVTVACSPTSPDAHLFEFVVLKCRRLTVKGGPGADTVMVWESKISDRATISLDPPGAPDTAADHLTFKRSTIAGPVKVTAGPGADLVEFIEETNPWDSGVYGPTLVDLGTGDDRMTVNGQIAIRTQFPRGLRVIGGDGADQLTLTNASFGGVLRLDLGAGNDVVGAENVDVAAIALTGGAGDDHLWLSEWSVSGNVAMDFGAGNDGAEITTPPSLATPPRIVGVERRSGDYFFVTMTDAADPSRSLLFDAATGEFTFSSGGAVVMSGVAKMTTRGSRCTLTAKDASRHRLSATWDVATNRGTAVLRTKAAPNVTIDDADVRVP